MQIRLVKAEFGLLLKYLAENPNDKRLSAAGTYIDYLNLSNLVLDQRTGMAKRRYSLDDMEHAIYLAEESKAWPPEQA